MTPSHLDSKNAMAWVGLNNERLCLFVPLSQEYSTVERWYISLPVSFALKRHFSSRITCVAMYNNRVHYKSEIYTYCLRIVTFMHAVLPNTSRAFFVLLTVFAEPRMAQQALEKLVNSGLPFTVRAILL